MSTGLPDAQQPEWEAEGAHDFVATAVATAESGVEAADRADDAPDADLADNAFGAPHSDTLFAVPPRQRFESLPEPEVTGDARVDAATARLGELAELPSADQVAVYDDVHRRLHDALADAEVT